MDASHINQFLEAVMLICFGRSWPLSLIKSYKARTAKATSIPFIIFILVGYVAGITAKFFKKTLWYVWVVYLFSLVVVSMNLWVYFRNKKLDKAKEEKAING